MVMDPCRLEVRPPLFGREAWATHANYPGQLLLVGSHRNFVHISKALLATAREVSVASGGFCGHLERVFSSWQQAMRSHEAYEEGKLYPFLSRRYCVSLEALVRDHHDLDELRAEVHRALGDDDIEAIRSSLARFHETLVRHLREEEDAVIPMLLELPPEVFRHYTVASPRELAAGASCAGSS